ncbi:MAG TPA: CsbD family protein [Acidobacteriaceae bacterium]|jgi:uncharacterized protein YjbJ (UPF0337 family)|nr:CsbD family protein [Acidobacteriaceae bacterium]
MKLLWLTAGVGLGIAAYLIFNTPAPRYATGSEDEDVEDAARATAHWGTRQKARGAGSDVLGRVKQGIGNLTGSDQLADEGTGDRIAAAVQHTAGDVAQAAGQTLHDLNR